MSNLKNALSKGRAADRFRSLMLAFSENAEGTFSALSSDLAADLKQYNSSMDELLEFVGVVSQHLRNNGGPKAEEMPSTTFRSTDNSPLETMEALADSGSQRVSTRVHGNCGSCGKSTNLIAGLNQCRDCHNNMGNASFSEDANNSEARGRRHCADCSKRLSVKREVFGICLYCDNKRKGIENPSASRLAQKLELIE